MHIFINVILHIIMIKLDKNLIYIIEYNEIDETLSSEELRKKYVDSTSNKTATEKILYKLYEEIGNLSDCIFFQ